MTKVEKEEMLKKISAMDGIWRKDPKNGNPISYTIDNPQIEEITEDWIFYPNGTCSTEVDSETLIGTWLLKEENTTLEVNMASTIIAYTILKLTPGVDGEMVWGQTLNGNVYEFRLSSLL